MDKIKVLLAEDEASLGMIVSETLESRDFEVFHAKDGQEALAVLSPSVPIPGSLIPKSSKSNPIVAPSR